jgi:hypothetical protein
MPSVKSYLCRNVYVTSKIEKAMNAGKRIYFNADIVMC